MSSVVTSPRRALLWPVFVFLVLYAAWFAVSLATGHSLAAAFSAPALLLAPLIGVLVARYCLLRRRVVSARLRGAARPAAR
ncbi:hypothetical protein HUT16_26190 [Kitasatospora sp. NA04385]|uniref:hypothetical protein n=1 Tax=Kitasatospora sp. NA04385 TaxID=2742135 RepID=UPI001591C993|nr:hypothetical protein [Kitasatospora sp. NA04385]QKW22093.1 hypothetical protein HUT16_26190 [Kitasatospora sp. NA04385]